MRIRVRNIRVTGVDCPSQWEAVSEDGRQIYIRYRLGRLSVRVSAVPTRDIWEAVDGEEIMSKKIGGEYDGEMTTAQMQLNTIGIIEWF